MHMRSDKQRQAQHWTVTTPSYRPSLGMVSPSPYSAVSLVAAAQPLPALLSCYRYSELLQKFSRVLWACRARTLKWLRCRCCICCS